jgi:hypothetical protein
MRARLASIAIGISAACGGVATPAAEPSTLGPKAEAATPPVSDELLRAAWALAERLGDPDLRGKPFVRVSEEWSTIDGFLVAQGPDGFDVAYAGEVTRFDTRVAPPLAPDAAPPFIPTWKALDLASTIGDCAERARSHGSTAVTRARARVELFELARAAHLSGAEPLARRALGEVAALPASGDLVATLRSDLAGGALDVAIRLYVDGSAKRPAMRDRLRSIAERFAGTAAADRARTWAAALDRMIGDEAAPTPASGDPIEARLRTIEAAMRDRPCDRDSGWGAGPDDGPVGLYVGLGFTAVPALIAMMGDDRLTRCTSAPPGIDPPQLGEEETLRTFGDLARDALKRISRKAFGSREEAQSWWRAMQASCELDELGGYDVVLELKRAIRNDVGAGVARTAKAVPRAFGRLRVDLVGLLADTPADAPVSLLVEETVSGPIPSARVRAASGLHRRHVETWIGPVVGALLEGCTPPCESDDIHALGAMLVEVRTAEARSALERLYEQAGPDARRRLLFLLAGETSRSTPLSVVARRLFLRALSDEARLSGAFYPVASIECRDPRLEDLAAEMLAEPLKIRVRCDMVASGRESRIKAMRSELAARPH